MQFAISIVGRLSMKATLDDKEMVQELSNKFKIDLTFCQLK
jgi:hypothetical protein